MTDLVAVKHDLLVQARNGVAVAYAQYWLALKRAGSDEGTARTAALAEADNLLKRAAALNLRAEAFQAELTAYTTAEHDEPQSAQSVRRQPGSAAERHRRDGIDVGRSSVSGRKRPPV
jgi:hypothetical protein